MPLFMDVHEIAGGVAIDDVAQAHLADLQTQPDHDVNYLRYWVDEKVAQLSVQYRLSYTPLTRQYRLTSGLLAQQLDSLEEVERILSRVVSRPVVARDALTKGARYDAALRLRLDVAQLPKPFQVNALTSRDWSLQSDWYRWSFTP